MFKKLSYQVDKVLLLSDFHSFWKIDSPVQVYINWQDFIKFSIFFATYLKVTIWLFQEWHFKKLFIFASASETTVYFALRFELFQWLFICLVC